MGCDGDSDDDTICTHVPRKSFQVDVLLLTRRSLSPTYRMYDTGLVESDKMSQWGWCSADSVMYRKKVRHVNDPSSFAFTTMYSPECIPSPAPQDIHMTSTSPSVSSGSDQATVKGGAKSKWSPSENAKLSVFDILNIFRCRWFLSRACLLANTISAQKDEDGNISWVEFTPPYHSHLVKCAVALVPHPVLTVKKVMFVYILELLNGKGNLAFFDLQTGGRKANNAQKEKRHLARKRSRAAKREREREAVKAVKLPAREQQCLACG